MRLSDACNHSQLEDGPAGKPHIFSGYASIKGEATLIHFKQGQGLPGGQQHSQPLLLPLLNKLARTKQRSHSLNYVWQPFPQDAKRLGRTTTWANCCCFFFFLSYLLSRELKGDFAGSLQNQHGFSCVLFFTEISCAQLRNPPHTHTHTNSLPHCVFSQHCANKHESCAFDTTPSIDSCSEVVFKCDSTREHAHRPMTLWVDFFYARSFNGHTSTHTNISS